MCKRRREAHGDSLTEVVEGGGLAPDRDLGDEAEPVLPVEKPEPEVLAVVVRLADQVKREAGHVDGIPQKARGGFGGLPDDGPGGDLQPIAHGESSFGDE
ncbi:MAG: hypothetical protein COU08_00235 [Candidatus Harrisonbacteria bacterium CG10_big_fil_rev_8_21_14_0_10_42_17]|uniref:Uncharacterized protein n=1 Tax=Candidatus Harrisonbacteria bacterium CG10_big_fil_rev_8_21_14_0_10_42_17 TaxID=1974584 RepID=A0A2M6WJC0_9BACT|nr:MAG: hypothetical protein COU08_00235 [Candidatus Harrisonbacteria bacterium CG10_big_fil_rev_8_21_14_0_10_42_17]